MPAPKGESKASKPVRGRWVAAAVRWTAKPEEGARVRPLQTQAGRRADGGVARGFGDLPTGVA